MGAVRFSFRGTPLALRKVFGEVAWHSRNSRCLSCTWLKPGGEKERCSSSPVGFHMVAELPGASTVEAMSRPEQEETEEVFEKAGEKLRAKVS